VRFRAPRKTKRLSKNMRPPGITQVRGEKSFSDVRLSLFFHAVQDFGDIVFVLA